MIRNEKTEVLWQEVAAAYAYQEAVLSLQMHITHYDEETSWNDNYDCLTKPGSPFLNQALFVVESTKRLQADIDKLLVAVQEHVQKRAWDFVNEVYSIKKGDILEYTDRPGVRKRGTIASIHIGSTEYGDIGFRGANIRADDSVGKKEVWFNIERDKVLNVTRWTLENGKHEPPADAAAGDGQ